MKKFCAEAGIDISKLSKLEEESAAEKKQRLRNRKNFCTEAKISERFFKEIQKGASVSVKKDDTNKKLLKAFGIKECRVLLERGLD